VPSKADLPTADELFERLRQGGLNEVLSRPPWGCVATPELALDLLNVHPQSLWNWKLRRCGPKAEPEPRKLYRKVGHRTLFRYDSVLSWLPGGDARPLHWWAWEWMRLAYDRLVVEAPGTVLGPWALADDPERVVRHGIGGFEQLAPCRGRRFGFRKCAQGLEYLRGVYGAA
jgi:hypothetical protein